jgi:hypothetical protein
VGATSGAGTAYPSGAHEFTPCFSGVRVTRSFVLCVCFVLLSFFPPLCCLFFFELRSLITSLVSSNYSYQQKTESQQFDFKFGMTDGLILTSLPEMSIITYNLNSNI